MLSAGELCQSCAKLLAQQMTTLWLGRFSQPAWMSQPSIFLGWSVSSNPCTGRLRRQMAEGMMTSRSTPGGEGGVSARCWPKAIRMEDECLLTCAVASERLPASHNVPFCFVEIFAESLAFGMLTFSVDWKLVKTRFSVTVSKWLQSWLPVFRDLHAAIM